MVEKRKRHEKSKVAKELSTIIIIIIIIIIVIMKNEVPHEPEHEKRVIQLDRSTDPGQNACCRAELEPLEAGPSSSTGQTFTDLLHVPRNKNN
eukprot:429119-Rhodomonas_salina.2